MKTISQLTENEREEIVSSLADLGENDMRDFLKFTQQMVDSVGQDIEKLNEILIECVSLEIAEEFPDFTQSLVKDLSNEVAIRVVRNARFFIDNDEKIEDDWTEATLH